MAKESESKEKITSKTPTPAAASSNPASDSVLLVAGPLAVGFVFGYALDYGQVNVPSIIQNQFDFTDFTMLRMFLAASATSTLAVNILHYMDIKVRSPCPGITLAQNDIYGSNIVGGLLLGSGMALTGSCPGTIWSQLGGRPELSRLFVTLGAITGAIVFGYTKDYIHLNLENFLFHKKTPTKLSHFTLNLMSYAFIAVVSATLYQLTTNNLFAKNLSFEQATLPIKAGVLVGLLQFPCNAILGLGLGASSGWVYFANSIANLFDTKLETHSPYLASARTDKKSKWQALQGFGAVLGGLTSALVRGTVIASSISASTAKTSAMVSSMCLNNTLNFIGGAMLLFGARLGGGCTSGHGLTGVANMSVSSFVTVGSMFSGAIVTKLLMDTVGL